MLDQLIAQVLQGMSGGTQAGGRGGSPLMQILLQLLAGGIGGGARGGAGGLGGLVQGRSGGSPLDDLVGAFMGGQGGGGLGGLLDQLQNAGLKRETESWVSRGSNLPIGPEQLTRAFGRERVEALAQEHGMDVDDMLAGLSAELPRAVDELTPEGRLPRRDELAGLFAGLEGGPGRA